jgi:hypothetical protein
MSSESERKRDGESGGTERRSSFDDPGLDIGRSDESLRYVNLKVCELAVLRLVWSEPRVTLSDTTHPVGLPCSASVLRVCLASAVHGIEPGLNISRGWVLKSPTVRLKIGDDVLLS